MTRVEDIHGLTPLQQAMLVRAVLEPASAAYVEQLRFEFGARPDPEALRQAWQGLCSRHPAMRSTFHHTGLSEPQQVVHGGFVLPWRVEDWRQRPDGDIDALAWAERDQGFELARPPLFRLVLVLLPDSAVLIWTFHHLLLDGWSLGRVLVEVDEGYRTALSGASDDRPAAPPFREFIKWLRAVDPVPGRKHWRSRLAGASITRFGGETGGAGGEHTVRLGTAASERIRAACKARAVTLGTLATVGWAACVAEPDAAQDVTFASLLSGRPADLPGVDGMIGMLVNTVATRVRFEPEETVHALLARVQGELVVDRRHGWTPLDEVARAAGLSSPDSVLVIENYPVDRAVLDGSPLAVRSVSMDEQADVPLVVAIVPGEDIELRLATPPGGFTNSALEELGGRLAAYLLNLADGMDDNAAALLGRREAERQKTLRGRIGRPLETADGLVKALLAAGPTVIDGDDHWPADRILAESERFARLAHAMPPGPVAIVADTTAQTIAQMLGCLRAGRTYVPLDHSDPRHTERAEHTGARPLPDALDPGSELPSLPDADAIAYLLHTSGTTGKPKAVVQTHSGVLAHARRFASSIGLRPSDRVCMTASFAFDAAVMDIFAASVVGATIVIGSPKRHGLRALHDEILPQATVLHTTPSVFRLLAAEGLPRQLRAVVLGGESVLPTDMEIFDRAAPQDCVLVNGFGPSESTTALQWFAEKGATGSRVPVGLPVTGTEAWLRGADGERLDAPWAQGEIVLVGDAVAQGYHGDTDAAGRFSRDGDRRAYRTGDCGRLRPSGCIEIIGRVDDQVQIGGVRVEPGEVRAVLAGLPGVTAAEVLAVQDGTDVRLHAFASPGTLDADGLLRALGARLPSAFVPAQVRLLDRLPLLDNGKVDRAALRAGTSGPGPDSVTAPAAETSGDPVLATVVATFADVVGKAVDPDRSLFDLGANSLDALRVAGRLENRLSQRVPLQLLFDHPTPRALVAALSAAPEQRPAAAIPRAERHWQTRGATRPAPSDEAPAISLFFFSGHADDPAESYRLLVEAAVRADELGLEAVWTPERHFDAFGGTFPNPSVIAAHLAACTQRLRLRAGSVVLPLHDPVRVAEEWAVVDQLSGGRVDLAIASGWHRRDFVLAKDPYAERKNGLLGQINVLRRLWDGDAVELTDAEGEHFSVRTWPRPVQERLPLWLTSQSPETFELAARHGLNVLTNLNYKSIGELSERVARYRRARGDQRGGRVTVMTHTLVGKEDAETRGAAVEAYADYALHNLVLQQAHARGADKALRPSDADARALALRSAERMVEHGGLVGDLDRCRDRLAELRAAGADEVACLIDFGVPADQLLQGVEMLGELVETSARRAAPKSAVLPAAPLQAQLWVLESLSDAPGTWMIPTLVRLEGTLDKDELRSRLAALCDRHEALRTYLEERDGRVVQVVWDRRPVSLETRSVASEAEALRQARDILDEGLDLGQAPLVRAVLLQVAPTHHVFLLACHHAIADGSSTVALARELFDGVPDGRPLQLGDWAAWMEQRVRDGDLDAQESWWDEALRDLPPRLRLGSGVANGRRAVHPIPLEPAVETALRSVARTSGATRFEIVLTAFVEALGHLAGQSDLVVGLHHANRDREELEGLVGPLVNLLPFRVRLPLQDALGSVRDQARAALQHHEVPYARLAARHATEHRPGTDPFVDAALLYQNLPEVVSEGPLKWSRLELEGGQARFPATLVATEGRDGLVLQLDIDEGLFTGDEAARLGAAVKDSLRGLLGVAAPTPARVEPERAVRSAGPHLLGAFVEYAEQHPVDTAVVGPDGSLTRAELLGAARRLAAALRARVPAGSRIGVQVPPGCAMIVAVYGVLLADCTVVPLDPRSPAARRRLELELADVELAVSDVEVEVPRLEPFQSGPERTEEPSGTELAYLIFTSGSTGVPKPVAVGHDSVRALIGWARTVFSEDELTGALLTAPIRFDMSVFGLYVPLAGAGSIVVIRDVAALVEGPPPAPVRLVYTVPSALREVLAAGGLPDTVRTVNLGGEGLPADLLADLLTKVERVCNLYGPTESTSNAFFEDYTEPVEPTIGRPIAGTGAWIRRLSDGACAEAGESGELVLTGAGLALGYLGLPDHPAFTPEGYRTGDRARLLPDGSFTYIGRIDDQVKVRGHRVQLQEIDAHLSTLSSVEVGACRLDGDSIEAWIVPAGGCDHPAQAEPRRAEGWAAELAEALPPYFLPSRWIIVPRLPLSTNGKLDRKALGTVEWTPLDAATLENPAQTALAAVWDEVLGVPVPSADADFFALGGHSLLAITLCRRIEDRLNVRVPLRTLFDHPTVAALEVALRNAEQAPDDVPVLVEDPLAAEEPFPLTELQQAYWVGGRDDMALGSVGTQGYVEFDTQVPTDQLVSAFRVLVRRHDMLRAVFDPDGRQRVLTDPGEFPVAVEDLREAPESALIARREERSHHRPDPSCWPLVRVWVSRLADRTRVHISVPALIADAHSVYLLARELAQLIDGRELPPPGPAYRDLAVALARRDRTRDDEEFASHAASFPAGPQLPLASDLEQLNSVRFDRREIRLDATTWRSVREAGAAHGLTPAGTLLSAYAWVLGGWAEEPEFALGVTFFDRPPIHPDVDRVVGDFTSARLVRVSPAEDLGAFATTLQGRLWEALDSNAFDAVRSVRTLRRLGRAHTFPVVFTSTLGLDAPGRGSLGEVAYALTQTSQVWLDHKVREEDGGLVSTWDFVTGLFRPGVVEAMMERFRATLHRLARGDWSPAVPGLPADQQRERHAYGATAWSTPGPALLHQTLLAGGAPDALALVTPEGEHVTHGALASAAGAVARRLTDSGLQVGDVVAVESRHGWRQAAAALGVMAAGGAFVPIDPAWPQRRIEAVLKTAGARCVVEPASWASGLPRIELADADRTAPLAPLPELVGPEDLAYILFTSGSTGYPKGVEISHAAAMNTLADIVDRFRLNGDRVLGLSGLHFDLSVFDLFGSWLSGGAVVHPEVLRDPAAWVDRMEREAVSVWNSVPALAEMLVEHLEATGRPLPGLRLVLMSGDWIPVTLADRLRAVAPQCRVISLGGATEGAIWSIAHEIGEHDPAWPSVPYGRPLRNQGMHVLDVRRNPRPDWVTGEIHISGRGVACGYRGDYARTAAAFWTDPRTGEPFYATGDLGRFRPDGTIEFLGRRDGQVKIRGHRVELGEIEAAVLEHPEVRQVAITAPRARSGQRHLVAHVVGTADEASVRRHLTERLPEAHVPRQIHMVDALALTANGKVDRTALEEPAAAPAEPASDQLLAMFREVLGQPDAGADDDFFALGGDSVLAIRLVSLVEKQLGQRLPVRDMFANPTVRGLSTLLRAGDHAPAAVVWDPELRERAKRRQGHRKLVGLERALPVAEPSESLRSRRSHRTFVSAPVPAQGVERLLALLVDRGEQRLYPSAGGAHGVQAYLQVAEGRVDGLAGSWFVDTRAGRLTQVRETPWEPAVADSGPNRSLAHGAAFAVVLVADLDTLEPLYGEAATRLATLEAGYMGQLLAGESAAFDLALCPVGSVAEARLDAALELGPRRKVIHALLGGRPLASGIRADAVWSGTPAESRPGPVLLTGAAGTLGSALLAELLRQGHEVHCLLRGDAESRLAEVLRAEGVEHHADRAFAWAGDLDAVIPEQAPARFGTVVHAAADVSFVKDYATLALTNVEGTRRILDLCADGAVLHYISSLSVFSDHGRDALPEETPLPADPPVRGGYAQSKWASENLVRSFVARGGQAHVHRLALVVDRHSGADDYVTALVRGCKATGAYPDVDVDLPLVRRNVAAKAVVASLGMSPRTWHLQEEPAPTLRQIADATGTLEAVPPDQWLRRVETAVSHDPSHPLAPYVELLRASRTGGALDPAGPRGGRLDGRRSWRLLAEAGVQPGTNLEALLQELI
ncbi:amino acid adenylation domain-containing protein [Kitasatospora aureofaciens]|uniref:non-ribosomal peptide synthetase n=1 Tax=Kitasatospora aureofaciens TaxID=1894 RepID=UPI001C437321|nr:non-ribosomal peptide synthetase [Kitasatospora aureofaciens]MBV6695654.1 amino acid adenylation domain-containing protein [Kitasatospora aureofaciens]